VPTRHCTARRNQSRYCSPALGYSDGTIALEPASTRASRGAIFPALQEAGLDASQARRAEAALREGKWILSRLLVRLEKMVTKEHKANRLTVAGWNPLLIDWVGFYRPHLKGCTTKHFTATAGKALPAIELGMIARPMTVGERKFPLLCGQTRDGQTLSLLQAARSKQQKGDVLIADRQVKISHLHKAGIQNFVIRAAVDFTAREKNPPTKTGRGRRPTKGQIVRPLARHYRGETIAATKPHREEGFVRQGRRISCHWFEDLVIADCDFVFRCVVIVDPKYKAPWLLLTDLRESGETIFRLYQSRWKIEQLPQTGKQLLGGHRSFVHGDESRFRLPELCLLAASLCLYLSATTEAVATGFWDRNPKPTPGRYRRVLAGAMLPDIERDGRKYRELADYDANVEKMLTRVRPKRSVFDHLPLGILAHRRHSKQHRAVSLTGN